jgi:hypothetical protein
MKNGFAAAEKLSFTACGLFFSGRAKLSIEA